MPMTPDDPGRWWWEQEMRALDARLDALLEHFHRMLDAADSDIDLFESEEAAFEFERGMRAMREIGEITWGTEADQVLIESLVTEWLGAVNKEVFQRKIAKARPGQMQKLVTEEVVAMRPLSDTEREELWNSLADTGPMGAIKLRLANLYEFHVQFLRTVEPIRDQDKEAETRFKRGGSTSGPQDKEAKRRFPKALVEDRQQLAGWVIWRGLIMMHLVEPRREEISARGGFGSKEEALQFLQDIAGGSLISWEAQ